LEKTLEEAAKAEEKATVKINVASPASESE
jgi:hypothetical protein